MTKWLLIGGMRRLALGGSLGRLRVWKVSAVPVMLMHGTLCNLESSLGVSGLSRLVVVQVGIVRISLLVET